MARDVLSFAINEHPDSANPFEISLAFSTRQKQIFIASFKYSQEQSDNSKLVKNQRISLDDNALALSYSRNCLCYSTSDAYHLYNVNRKTTIRLFQLNSLDDMKIMTTIGLVSLSQKFHFMKSEVSFLI